MRGSLDCRLWGLGDGSQFQIVLYSGSAVWKNIPSASARIIFRFQQEVMQVGRSASGTPLTPIMLPQRIRPHMKLVETIPDRLKIRKALLHSATLTALFST